MSFETELLEGVPKFPRECVVNYTDADTPYTRIIEHKHFEFGTQSDTVNQQGIFIGMDGGKRTLLSGK